MVLIGTGAAMAQPGAAVPPTPAPATSDAPASAQLALGIRIEAVSAEIDAHAVRDAVAADLDVPVAETTGQQPALGVVTVTVERNAARLVYRRADGVSTERTLTLPPEPAARVELLAFMVTNLVRDQTSEALAQLSRRSQTAPATPTTAATTTTNAAARRDATAGDGSDEVAFSAGVAPPILLDRLHGEHHVVGGGLYLLIGVQDGSRAVSISALADYQRRFASGVQLGGVAAITSRLDGVQLAGAASIAGAAHGVQIGGATAIASSIHGVQLTGGVNAAGEVHGVQIGTVNVARHLHGVQFGALNISDGDDDAVPIGPFNYARHGRTEFEGLIDTSGMSTVLLRHGPRRVQNMWGVAHVQGHNRLFAGIGLGAHFASDAPQPVALDLDGIGWSPLQGSSHNLMILSQLRATLAFPVGPVDIIGGVIGNVYVDDGQGIFQDLHPHLDQVYRSGTTLVAIWPSGFLGIRLRA